MQAAPSSPEPGAVVVGAMQVETASVGKLEKPKKEVRFLSGMQANGWAQIAPGVRCPLRII